MENIIEELVKIGFNKIEASTYITLVEKGEMTGYQAAKHINVSRASIYPVLESLCRRGVISLIPGEPNLYVAEEPVMVIEKMKIEYSKSAENAKEKLMELSSVKPKEKYINIEGYEKIISKTKELLLTAEKEVIIHTDFDMKENFSEELKILEKRKVKVIVFSWGKMDVEGMKLDFYTRGEDSSECCELRMMIVVDFNKTMIAGNSEFIPYIPPGIKAGRIKKEILKHDFVGTYSENKLFSRVITEHIHFDIYIIKLMEKYGKDFIDKSILVGTLMEKGETLDAYKKMECDLSGERQ